MREPDVIVSLADQASESADDTGEVVTLGKDEWYRLLDAIYDEGEFEGDDAVEVEA